MVLLIALVLRTRKKFWLLPLVIILLLLAVLTIMTSVPALAPFIYGPETATVLDQNFPFNSYVRKLLVAGVGIEVGIEAP